MYVFLKLPAMNLSLSYPDISHTHTNMHIYIVRAHPLSLTHTHTHTEVLEDGQADRQALSVFALLSMFFFFSLRLR